MDTPVLDCPNAVAIIGLAGRFPGAADLEQFWQNLARGRESIRFLADEELLAAGVPPELVHHPEYVKAAPLLDGSDLFDAKFFGFSPHEALLTDPQHRLFLECAWEALEQAGYCGESYDGAIGVFAGSGPSLSSYLASETHLQPGLFAPSGSREHIGNDKDYLCTRVSYKLNLRGPSITVQTACSTSLVAVHLGCQSLLAGESDLVLAGGVTVRVPQIKGHLTRDNAMASHDGHCRAFDAAASGTMFGSGVGVVVLKRLSAARADRDVIHAVIRGSAVNNDGTAKISFWASSVEGQVPAMVEALTVAGVDPETVTMVEAHGTGTTLGDPVEVQALTRAFRTAAHKTGYCALGTVKTNVGHLDSASGIAGLIKAVLALERRAIPASLHFHTPNPRIDFARTPFFVNTALRPWDTGGRPRRAAVNSLGIGGTNAFVVLEEAPPPPAAESPTDAGVSLLPLTAKSEPALRELAERYVAHFARHAAQPLADAAFTAATGRAMWPHRLAVIASSADEAREHLQRFLAGDRRGALLHGQVPRSGAPQIALRFSPAGRQPWAAYGAVYAADAVFRRILDDAAERIRVLTGRCLLPVAAAAADAARAAPDPLAALAVQMALAAWLRGWGITPCAVAGRGSGGVAARVANGECSLDDAIQQVANWSDDSGQGERPWPAGAPPDVVWEIGWAAPAAPAEQHDAAALWLPGLAGTACPWRHLLQQLATVFVRGTPVNWKAFQAGAPPRHRVVLPTYPFQRKRFWLEPVAAALSGKWGSRDPRLGEDVHPVLGRRLHSALHPEQRVYELTLDAGNPLLAADRPGSAGRTATEATYRELARLAVEDAFPTVPLATPEFQLHERLTLADNESRIVQVALLPDGVEAVRLEIHSRPRDGSATAPPAWQHHVSGRLPRGPCPQP